jgi:hypothetical protein
MPKRWIWTPCPRSAHIIQLESYVYTYGQVRLVEELNRQLNTVQPINDPKRTCAPSKRRDTRSLYLQEWLVSEMDARLRG